MPSESSGPGGVDQIKLAIEAAEQLFHRKAGLLGEPVFEPTTPEEARAAVQHLGELFDDLPGSIVEALGSARRSATLLSSDRLQGLAEIVQNADDVGASRVRLCVRPGDLLVSHDGSPVRLLHVLGLATPWLTTKADDAAAIGRFGVGLSTLQSLSTALEVHCPPYHVRIGEPTLMPIESADLPPAFSEPDWTALRIPLGANTLKSDDLKIWLDRWGDSGLLFLRHVTNVTLLDSHDETIHEIALSRSRNENMPLNSELASVSRELAKAKDGRSWVLYSADAPSPQGVERAQKTAEASTPIAVALPLAHSDKGQVYAGLPVASTRTPLFASAQFDPLTNRQGFADTPWNKALVPLVAELWSEAVLDLFARAPQACWQAMPLPSTYEDETESPVTNALEAAILEKARQVIAPRLSFPIPEQGQVNLRQIAVEAQPLEGILQESETAKIAGLSATLPIDVRDSAGRWRLILDDWRNHGAGLPEPVSVEQALGVVGDEGRSIESTIALVATALREDLGERLLELPCVIAHDGRRLVPPARASITAVSTDPNSLAEQLGITTLLHPAHLASKHGAPEVLAWLRDCGALLASSDDNGVVRRLAEAGKSGRVLSLPLTNEQVSALRDAFERMNSQDRADAGYNVGCAVRLESYTYDAKGHKQPGVARPVEAYIPGAIDLGRDTFAFAAAKSQGLIWLNDAYGKTLRSERGRAGVGALRFLGLLGAETMPRLRPHADLQQRYQYDLRKGLSRFASATPPSRAQAMREMGAEYTLEDYESPDLLTVITSIGRERQRRRRRERATALLETLGRAWERRRLNECAEVDAVAANRAWILKGTIPAFWIAQAGDMVWLDDERGVARKPNELQIRTEDTEALYGLDSPNYLHKAFPALTRRDLLTALGVSNQLNRSELVQRLRVLKQALYEDEKSTDRLRDDTALVYRALARNLNRETRASDLTLNQLRLQFNRDNLVFTNLGWRSPQNVIEGPRIFGNLQAFTPTINECEPLWKALRIRKPSVNDCLETLRKIANRRKDAPNPTEEAILLDTLRALTAHLGKITAIERRKLANLTLFTSKGWMRKRPIYAIEDSLIAANLGERLPIWQPGGGLEQFRSLLDLLRVTEILSSEAEVLNPAYAQEDSSLTDRFQQALELLRDDLQRNDPRLAEGLIIPWANLAEYTVKVHPTLTLGVGTASGLERCQVKAKIDTSQTTLYITNEAVLNHMDTGRALAALFNGDTRRVAQAWLAACVQTMEGIRAQTLILASELAERESLEFDSRLADLQERIGRRRESPHGAIDQRKDKPQPSNTAINKQTRVPAPRVLVTPQSLVLVDPKGRMVKGSSRTADDTQGRQTRGGGLKEPTGASREPLDRISPPGYSDLQKESVGKELLQILLSSDEVEIADLRTERGVGADAVDELGKFYELKVHAGAEPDEVNLTAAEMQRALTTHNFFLVIVSNVEESGARPTVRFIVDPLRKLRPTQRGGVTLSGVRGVESLEYHFTQSDDQQMNDDAEPPPSPT